MTSSLKGAISHTRDHALVQILASASPSQSNILTTISVKELQTVYIGLYLHVLPEYYQAQQPAGISVDATQVIAPPD